MSFFLIRVPEKNCYTKIKKTIFFKKMYNFGLIRLSWYIYILIFYDFLQYFYILVLAILLAIYSIVDFGATLGEMLWNLWDGHEYKYLIIIYGIICKGVAKQIYQ